MNTHQPDGTLLTADIDLVTAEDCANKWGIPLPQARRILTTTGIKNAGTDPTTGETMWEETHAELARSRAHTQPHTTNTITLTNTTKTPANWHQLTQQQRDQHLPHDTINLIQRGINPNTLRAYRDALRPYEHWCHHTRRTPYPATENTMLTYLTHTEKQTPKPAPSTMWLWHAAMRYMHAIGNPPLPWEAGKRLQLAMHAYEKTMLQQGWRPRRAPRAYPHYVTQMIDTCDPTTTKGIRDRATILTAFLTAARGSHMGTYRIHDITHIPPNPHTQQPAGYDLYLPYAKNDQGGTGKTFSVTENPQRPDYCPVTAITTWLHTLRHHGYTTGAFLRPLTKSGTFRTSGEDPTYRMFTGNVSDIVKTAGKAAGLGDNYTCHSLRRGCASWLRELGMDPLDIARGCGWSPKGDSFLSYIEEVDRRAPDSVAMLGKL